MPQKKRTKAELKAIKQQVKKLMLEQQLTQKEIAQKLGVSEKSVSTWVKLYGWQPKYEQPLAIHGGGLRNLTGFVDLGGFDAYLQAGDPECYKAVLQHLSAYLYSLSLI